MNCLVGRRGRKECVRHVTLCVLPVVQLAAAVGEVIVGLKTSSCWAAIGDATAVATNARRVETRVVKVIIVERKIYLGVLL